jgi:hypothetical protein
MPSKRSASNDLSALEQRRLDNIARNEQFLSSLGLDDVKIEQEKVVKKVSQKGRIHYYFINALAYILRRSI